MSSRSSGEQALTITCAGAWPSGFSRRSSSHSCCRPCSTASRRATRSSFVVVPFMLIVVSIAGMCRAGVARHADRSARRVANRVVRLAPTRIKIAPTESQDRTRHVSAVAPTRIVVSAPARTAQRDAERFVDLAVHDTCAEPVRIRSGLLCRLVERGEIVCIELHVRRLEVLVQLRDARCADEDRRHRRSREQPGQRDLRW